MQAHALQTGALEDPAEFGRLLAIKVEGAQLYFFVSDLRYPLQRSFQVRLNVAADGVELKPDRLAVRVGKQVPRCCHGERAETHACAFDEVPSMHFQHSVLFTSLKDVAKISEGVLGGTRSRGPDSGRNFRAMKLRILGLVDDTHTSAQLFQDAIVGDCFVVHVCSLINELRKSGPMCEYLRRRRNENQPGKLSGLGSQAVVRGARYSLLSRPGGFGSTARACINCS